MMLSYFRQIEAQMFATMELWKRLIINHVLYQVKLQSQPPQHPRPEAETENLKSVKDLTELFDNYANGV